MINGTWLFSREGLYHKPVNCFSSLSNAGIPDPPGNPDGEAGVHVDRGAVGGGQDNKYIYPVIMNNSD